MADDYRPGEPVCIDVARAELLPAAGMDTAYSAQDGRRNAGWKAGVVEALRDDGAAVVRLDEGESTRARFAAAGAAIRRREAGAPCWDER